jgi:hypothetical protein
MESKQIVDTAMESLSGARHGAIEAWDLAWRYSHRPELVRLAENADLEVHRAWAHFVEVTR